MLGSGESGIVAYRLGASLIRANRFDGDYTGPLVVLSGPVNNTLLENRDLRSTDLPEPRPTSWIAARRQSDPGCVRDRPNTGTNNEILPLEPGGK